VTTPLIKITHRAFECAKMSFVEIVIDFLPLWLNRLGTVAGKIMQPTKLSKDGLVIESESHRIPFNTTLPIVVVCTTIFSPLTHNTFGGHSRTGAESIKYFVHSK